MEVFLYMVYCLLLLLFPFHSSAYPVYCLLLLLFPFHSSAYPLCTDLRAPTRANGSLAFCPYNETTCCNSTQDLQLQDRFQAMNISDSPCASAVKSILCAACDPFSASLFTTDSDPGAIPALCNSTNGNSSFCSTVWDSCRDIPIQNSPFVPALQSKAQVTKNSTVTRLTDLWQSSSSFCTAYGRPHNDSTLCFDGKPVSLNESDKKPHPKGICLERIGNGAYINMVPHPDGSSRAFFSSLPGKIWLATIPDQDSGDVMGIDESRPFVDLTDQVHLDTTFGMMGMAFHPDFEINGRFFASFNCDKEKNLNCSGRCSCNLDANCDPSKIVSPGGEVCRYQTVIAEYSAKGTGSSPSKAERASPQEVRRIFTMGLPFTSDHGGQILFGPDDGYLYIMMGDGGAKGDPYNFAQNKKSVLGKIMRVDVDKVPSEDEIATVWGNYSVPDDNPFREDKEMLPELWAYGLRNPWRCSFDSERPSYFLCADTGEDDYEEVDLISKGGNYGWRVYEGPLVFQPQSTPGGNTSRESIEPIFPVLGYSHAGINKLGSAAISGGYVYRSQTDACTYGSYLYADLYASHLWAASESPENSGNFTAKDVTFSCAADSPIKCDSLPDSRLPALQYIYSFGEDNRNDIYILTQSGVYRIVRPSRCKYKCSKEVKPSPSPTPSPPPTSTSHGHRVCSCSAAMVIFVSAILVFLGILL